MERSLTPPALQANPDWRIGIVASSFYKEEIDGLVEGAIKTLTSAGIPDEHIMIHRVPGSFEIPLIGAALAQSGQVDGLIGLGIIVEGQTQHARLLAENVTAAMMDVQMKYILPFAFEVLYVNDLKDARTRSIGENNKGVEAAYAVLQSLQVLKAIMQPGIE